MEQHEMRVLKRDGTYQDIHFDKIMTRIKKIGISENLSINYSSLTMKVIDQLYDGIPTTKIDELTAEQCASLSTQHPDYGTLANSIIISNHHKNTDDSFFYVMQRLYDFYDNNGIKTPLIAKYIWEFIYKNREILESFINDKSDYLFDYFGFKTLEKSYLMKINGIVVERPQYMWLRVAIGIHAEPNITDENKNKEILERIKQTYDLMSQKYFTHATPTLFNAGTPRPQLSSCYLISMESDSLDGIFDTLKDCARISKWAGGIGLHIHNIRGAGSLIRGTNGESTGIIPMLRVFNNTARYINQGGRRNGSFAIYLEPWHSDIQEFLELKRNQGDEEMKARDLFYALWIPDLFMKKIKAGEDWCLFCPDECPGLSDVYGEDFENLYNKYEKKEVYKKKIKARDLWFKILDSQMETGTPYLCYKDAANKKSNQKNLGIIKSSNLCTEIMEFSDDKETAVCNLASIALNKFVDEKTKTFNYEELHKVTRVVTRNLNRVIDINFYPTEKTKRSNLLHRPIGIGVQGLADVFFLMDIAFHSDLAIELNKNIFETIYHASLTESNNIAKERYEIIMNEIENGNEKNIRLYNNLHVDVSSNSLLYSSKNSIIITQNEYDWLWKTSQVGAYSSFIGSPASKGILQFDMWNIKPSSGLYDWDKLKESIVKYGLRNSLLVAPMPTASTSQILGNNECFEPITSNIYMRRTLAGEFVMINKYLMKDLIDLGLWNEKMKNNIIANKGSVQHLTMLSDNMRNKYKTVWEIPMKHIIDMSSDRGAFICQSQSLNLWMEEPNYNSLTSMHFYGWNKGLKTGIYYLRRKAKHQAQQFTIEPDKNPENELNNNENIHENDYICESCSA